MPEPSPTQRASEELARAAFTNAALRAKFDLMVKETANRTPVADDFEWLSRPDSERVSLAPLSFEDAMRALLDTPPHEGQSDRPVSGL